ncbi:YceI family protein [Marinilongibacter aquaticus]|uniref:YceI family protein n=1 Tax=Marinilongibacter aquaticus TaxID=2975157 RepID=UPI0021BD487A|nr:YceI family protein [Marinilongibacter aquaticus]UBM58401.1 YceI family protein [Marinilongibacter aquaticus]
MQVLIISFLLFNNFFSSKLDKVKVVADAEKSSITFAMHHPLHAFDASADEFRCVAVYNTSKAQLELIAANATVGSFDSGNSNRDSHMIEVTEALKFPSVTFAAKQIEYIGEEVKANGELVFHGVKRPCTIVGKQTIVKGNLVIQGDFVVDMTEYNIEQPSIMGMKTDKEIKVHYTFSFPI